MKITQLKINSFRGIDDLTLKFNPDEPTVIMGVNGVGKSSILDCITVFLSWTIHKFIFGNIESKISEEILQGLQLNFLQKDSYKNREKSEIWIETTYNSIELCTYHITYNSSNEMIVVQTSSGRDFIGQIGQDLIKKIDNFEIIGERTCLNLPLMLYFPVNRGIQEISLGNKEDNNLSQLAVYLSSTNRIGANFDYFFQWFKLTEDLENEKIRDNSDYRDRGLQAVRQAIYSLIPEFSDLRIRRSPLRMTVNKKGGETTDELSIEQLSEGEKCLLAMVGDIARRLAIANPSLEDPLQGEGVVLIDEIELHLHPQWQRKIIPALTRTFPNCQFIVTTHSPQVASHVQPENIYILKSTPEGIKAFKPEASYGRDSNQILEDLMDTPSRPQEIQDQLRELFRLIADNKLEEAKTLSYKIAEEIGRDEPELVRAEVAIRRKELIGR